MTRIAWGIGELAEALGPRHPDEPDSRYSFRVDPDYLLMYYLDVDQIRKK